MMERWDVIDISKYNTHPVKIDWMKVKNAGVSAVMMRVGWAANNGRLAIDDQLDENIEAAHAAGLDVGLYVYSYVTSGEAARRAALETIAVALKHRGRITYPIAFDVEETKMPCLTQLGKKALTNTVVAFCETVKRAGYYPMWYTYKYFADFFLDTQHLACYDLWAAYYPTQMTEKCPWKITHGMWQYLGDHGRCDGVHGNCDRSYAYKDYATIIKLNRLNDTGSETIKTTG